MQINALAKMIILLGLLFMVIGAILLIASKYGFSGFKLPGDILVQRKNFTFYFPLTTAIIISVLLTIIFNFISRR